MGTAVALLVVTPALASTYRERLAAAVKQCEAIDSAQYQSGLYLNPDGYRSYYERSKCLQDAAVRFREALLCARVKRRWSFLSSSWGYSTSQCRQMVSDAVTEDRRALAAMKAEYVTGHVVLRDFRIEPNGNGRDFNIIPLLAGERGHGYTLEFEIIPPQRGRPPILFHSSGYFLDGSAKMSIYVRQDEIRQRMPDFALGQRYGVRARLIFSLPTQTLASEWSDPFIERAFPVAERSQAFTKESVFEAAVTRRLWPRS